MTFKTMACLTALAATVLGVRFIVAGASVLAQWNVAPTDGALVVCRRIGALYLGLALLFFLGRSAAPSELRSGVCLGVGAASAILAGLGVFELRAGRVGSGILVPVVAETLLAAGFALAWRRGL